MTVKRVSRISVPPGPKSRFILGTLSDFYRDPLGFLTSCAREYGDIVYLPGLKFYMLNHPDYIEAVLTTNSSQFSKNQGDLESLRPVFGNGVFVSEGDFWRRQRRLMQPAFHRERIAAYAEIMVDYTNRMLTTWQDGEIRDVYQDMVHLTMRIVAKTLFDSDMADKGEDVGNALEAIVKYYAQRLSSLVLALLPKTFPTPDKLRYQKAIQRLDAIIHDMIEQRRVSGEDRGDLLSMLIHAQDDDGSRMTNRQVRDEVMNMLLAGNETSALVLTWTWYLLSQHPEVEAKLAAELQALPPSLTFADLPRLHYTEMVVMEVMRLYPPGWLLDRTVIQECEIGGYRLPVGTNVMMSAWVVHRDPRYFDQPDLFNPERWADGLAKRLPPYAYFPFGGGPRVCIGRSFAMMEAVLLVATIARNFRLTLAPEEKVIPWPTFTLRPRHGLNMLLNKAEVGQVAGVPTSTVC